MTERGAGRPSAKRRRVAVVLAVVAGLFAMVVGVVAVKWTTDAIDRGIYADCPPQEWSQALLDESRVIAGAASESAGDYGDCDASGATNLLVAQHPDEGQCPLIVERAAARGWAVIQQTAPCELVMSRDLDGRTARLTLTSEEDATLGTLNLIGQWHREQ